MILQPRGLTSGGPSRTFLPQIRMRMRGLQFRIRYRTNGGLKRVGKQAIGQDLSTERGCRTRAFNDGPRRRYLSYREELKVPATNRNMTGRLVIQQCFQGFAPPVHFSLIMGQSDSVNLHYD
jgi:hypothetical protein